MPAQAESLTLQARTVLAIWAELPLDTMHPETVAYSYGRRVADVEKIFKELEHAGIIQEIEMGGYRPTKNGDRLLESRSNQVSEQFAVD